MRNHSEHHLRSQTLLTPQGTVHEELVEKVGIRAHLEAWQCCLFNAFGVDRGTRHVGAAVECVRSGQGFPPLQAKIDRGCDDYVEGRISDALWKRKSAEWETELATVTAELSALDRPITSFVATGLFARATETGEWRGVWDDFRNWLTSPAATQSGSPCASRAQSQSPRSSGD